MRAVALIVLGILTTSCAYEFEGGRYHKIEGERYSETFRKSQETQNRHRCSTIGSNAGYDECIAKTVVPYEAYEAHGLAISAQKNDFELNADHSVVQGSGPFDAAP